MATPILACMKPSHLGSASYSKIAAVRVKCSTGLSPPRPNVLGLPILHISAETATCPCLGKYLLTSSRSLTTVVTLRHISP